MNKMVLCRECFTFNPDFYLRCTHCGHLVEKKNDIPVLLTFDKIEVPEGY